MTVFGDSKRTAKLSNIQNYFYGEHYYFEKSNMTPEQLDTEKILFEVYDYNFPERKDFLAIYETDFQHIYSKPKHATLNFWFAMANPESDDFSKIRGYIRLSISVLCDKDDRVELNIEKDDKCNSILVMPPQIRLKHKQLKIHLLEAQQLPDMDSLLNTFKNKQYNECDAYVSIEFMGLRLNTSINIMKKNVAKWSETIFIPIIFPVVSHKIKMVVWDKDLGSNEIIGSYEIDVEKVLNNEYNNWQFIHIYGGPLNTFGKYTKKMNKYPEIGSSWHGKIFMKIEYEDDPSATKTEVRKMEKSIEEEGYANIEKSVFWTINITLHEAFFLPSEDNYKITVCVEHRSTSSMEIKAVNQYINFNGFKGTIKAQSAIEDPDSMGDLYIYLIKNGKNICFQRFKCSTFTKKNDVMMVKLLPDFALGEVKETRKAGILKLEINIKKTDFFLIEDDLNSSYNSAKNILHLADPNILRLNTVDLTLKYKNYFVVANIYQSRYLISGDADGTSDPYVKIKIGKQKLKTTIKNDTVNPIWNEFLVFDDIFMDYNDRSTWPIIYLECLDSDFVEFADDCLGYSYIWLNDTNNYLNDLKPLNLKPRWYQLYLPISNRSQGQLLMSFFILEKDKFPDKERFIKDFNIIPKIKKFSFEMNILGLRDLQPLSLIPVKKPYIIFDVNSINFAGVKEPFGKKESKSAIIGNDDKNNNNAGNASLKTQPKESGSNPNINTVLKFDVNLPLEEIYLPQLQCMVNDSMLAGLLNQLLGLFFIPIKAIVKEHQDLFEEDLKSLKKNILRYDNEIKEAKKKKVKDYVGNKILLEALKNNEINSKGIVKNIDEEEKLLKKDKKEKSLPVSRNESIRSESQKSMIYNEIFEEDEKLRIIQRPAYKKYTLPGIKEGSPNFKEYDIEDDSNKPPSAIWMEVGFNMSIEDNNKYKKHFRRKYMCELERANVYDMKSPFNTYSIKRGKFQDKKEKSQIFEALRNPSSKIFKYVKRTELLNEIENIKEDERINEINKSIESQKMLDDRNFGCFKGLIRILEKEKVDYCAKLIKKLTSIGKFKYEDYPYFDQFNQLSKELLCPKDVVVRIYILEFTNIKQKDALSLSDPFLMLKLGDQVINDIANRQEDVETMKVYRRFDLNAKLPGPSKLTIELYDHDFLFPNEFIGSTVIDIEDRFFDKNWKKLKHKPIEVRTLHDPDLPGVQAEVYLWIEIFEKSLRDQTPSWDIKPAPEKAMELRLIVWETVDIPYNDAEEVSDLYVKCFVDENNRKSTDIHYRCQNGCGSYNYRIILPIKYPSNQTTLKIQVFDNDLLSHDDFICGTDLDMREMIKDLYYIDVPMKFDYLYFEDLCNKTPELRNFIEFPEPKEKNNFWVKLFRMEGTEKKQIGAVKMSLEIMPIWKSEMCIVGEGRKEPNTNPFLPPPTGRFEWSMNPFKILNQVVGPGVRNKLYGACCCVFIILILLFVIPYIAMHIAAEALNPFRTSTVVCCNTTKVFLT